MRIRDVLGISNAKLLFGNEDYEFKGFSKDTRTIQKGDTYVGIKGEKFDGNQFFLDAFLNGADTCVLESVHLTDEIKEQYADRNFILVDDSVSFLMGAAKKKREEISVPVVAITGSVGKTSTKNIVADVLAMKYSVLRTIRNENSQIGMSIRLLNYQDEEIIVLEMGMNQKGEIKKLSELAQPDVAIITNIGTSHIGNLGSRENILKAKLEILEGLKGPIIVNQDNDLLQKWVSDAKYEPIITFGIHDQSDYQALHVSYTKDGTIYELKGEKIELPVIGDAFVYNSLCAFVVGDLFGVDHNCIKKVVCKMKTDAHRLEFIKKDGITIIDDTYNASYDSIASSLNVLKNLDGRKIAVLGDVFELGDYGEEIHRSIGALVAKAGIDLFVSVGSLARYMNEEAIQNGFSKENCFHFQENGEAIHFLKEILKPGDLVLVKASHGMNFLEIVEGLVNGDRI